MSPALVYRLLADAVLVLHVGIVLFVVGGLLLVLWGNLLIGQGLLGGRRRWDWVNAWWFRVLHLLAIGVVVAESWLGIECPLTTLEVALRGRAGEAAFAGDFIAHWLQRLLYLDLPGWAFTLAYSLFAAAVLATWWRFPPRTRPR